MGYDSKKEDTQVNMKEPHAKATKGLCMEVVDHSNRAEVTMGGEVVGEDNESGSSWVATDDGRERGGVG